MSLSATLSIALSGLGAAQHALAVTAGNVANANTDGYTRKLASQSTVVTAGQAAGTRADEPRRVVDEYLNAELREQQGLLARADVLLGYRDRIQESILGAPGEGDAGLANHVSRLASAAEALGNTPENGALRVGVVGAAQDLVRLIADDAAQVQAMRGDADAEIKHTVETVNADVQALQRLNGEIVRTNAAGVPADLLDERDRILSRLARSLPISIDRQENGTVAVYTRGGQALLDGQASRLDYQPAAQAAVGTTFGPIRLFRQGEIDPETNQPRAGAAGTVLVTGGVRAGLTPELRADATADAAQTIRSPFGSGGIQGLLDARDALLPGVADQLAELANLARYVLNAAHNDGAALPPPPTLAGTRTAFAGWDAAANSGLATVAVIDRATGATVKAFRVDPAAAATPADVAAQVNAGLGALGTASFAADGSLRISLADAGQGLAVDEGDSRIPVADAAGHRWTYGLAHYFGLNDLVVAQGTEPTRLAIRADIAADSSRLSSASLTVTAGPPLKATLGGAGDNRVAQALAAAVRQGVDTVARGAMPARRTTLDGYAADIVAVAAADASRAQTAQASTKAVVDDLAYRQGGVSGVNVDEELSRLVLYQQAYSVSARIVSITDKLFDDLLAIGR